MISLYLLGVNLQCLDDGSVIASTVLKNEAKYHNGCCETFQKDSDEPIHRACSQDCIENICKWAVESMNWVVHARLNTASDAEAGDVHYHIFCYTKLKNKARAAVNKSSNAETSYARQQYDPLVFDQLVAFVQFNNRPTSLLT